MTMGPATIEATWDRGAAVLLAVEHSVPVARTARGLEQAAAALASRILASGARPRRIAVRDPSGIVRHVHTLPIKEAIMLNAEGSGDATPTRNWSETLDLDRTTATKSYVDRMEECMRSAQTAADDLKEVLADAKEAEFSPRDIEAMRKIAKLRLKDQRGRAQEQLEALQRVGKAVGFDLFDWAGAEA